MYGFVRKVDELGRLCLPKEIRDTLHIEIGTPLEISTNGDVISLQKHEPDNLEEKVREMHSILNQQINEIGLERSLEIEKALNKIQEILQKAED